LADTNTFLALTQDVGLPWAAAIGLLVILLRERKVSIPRDIYDSLESRLTVALSNLTDSAAETSRAVAVLQKTLDERLRDGRA